MRMEWNLDWVGVSQVVGRDGAFRYFVMGTPSCLEVLKCHSERASLVMEGGMVLAASASGKGTASGRGVGGYS